MTSPVHHESSDISAAAVAGFGAGLVLAGVLIFMLVWTLFVYLSGRAIRRDSSAAGPPLQRQEQRLPPEPRLQTNPRGDLLELQQAEERALTTYGWVDRKTGAVRIPIEQAMKLTLERGLPSRAKQEPQR
jgi:hypothetical protein